MSPDTWERVCAINAAVYSIRPNPPDLQAFASWCMAAGLWQWPDTRSLYLTYLEYCDESDQRAVSVRVLQNNWHKIGGHRIRPNKGKGSRATAYAIKRGPRRVMAA